MAATRDRIVYEGAYGQSGEQQSVQVSADSMFWIASMSKPITSIAAMQLVEQDKLQLDSPIGELLPELANPQVLEGFAIDGRPLMRPAKGPITLRQLLAHTSGFGYAFGDFPGMEKRWGLGYLINTEVTPEGRSAGSLGWAGLANTFFWVDPVKQVAGVIMSQILPFGDPAMMEVFNQFEAGVYRQLNR